LLAVLALAGCSESTRDESCYSLIADSVCLEKWAEIEIGSESKDQIYMVELKLLWNDEQIKLIADDARPEQCRLDGDILITNIGKNVAILEPATLSIEYIEQAFRGVTRRDGRPIYWGCEELIAS
jgi:hypothetical protein